MNTTLIEPHPFALDDFTTCAGVMDLHYCPDHGLEFDLKQGCYGCMRERAKLYDPRPGLYMLKSKQEREAARQARLQIVQDWAWFIGRIFVLGACAFLTAYAVAAKLGLTF